MSSLPLKSLQTKGRRKQTLTRDCGKAKKYDLFDNENTNFITAVPFLAYDCKKDVSIYLCIYRHVHINIYTYLFIYGHTHKRIYVYNKE